MLSKKTTYALHSLTYLASKENNTPVLIAEIAENAKIPRKFLEAILLELKKAGILHSKMGKGGGYSLRLHPGDIKLSTVIRMFDGPIALLPCASINYYKSCDECEDEEACGLKKVFVKLRNETLGILDNKTIQDVIEEHGK